MQVWGNLSQVHILLHRLPRTIVQCFHDLKQMLKHLYCYPSTCKL